ncbi:MAG: methylated-DNA--[protein]-cysteine S-methyltransferase [Candidatus Edwardsbacteria bacterium]|nr:methylated-DNA--[protein]-cysteine S-methyltransferase [Candidatus Edwardsbacteria bacterium]
MDRYTKIYISGYDSPLGRLYLAATDKGLLRIAPAKGSELSFILDLGIRHFDLVPSEKPFLPIKKQLDRYFEGQPVVFRFQADISRGTGFQRSVWRKLSGLLPGQMMTYGMLAREIGRPKAYRAVGQAVGANPLPIIIPCHRVIASDGSLGGFAWGIKVKKKLLSIEGMDL